MNVMHCVHCSSDVAYVAQDFGKKFLCRTCGKPGIYGYQPGGEAPRRTASSGVDGTSYVSLGEAAPGKIPAPPRRASATGVLKVVGGGAIALAAGGGLLFKGVKHGSKALKPAVTRSLPTEIPTRFTASPFKSAAEFAPKSATAVGGSSTYVPMGAAVHGSRALARPASGDDRRPEATATPQIDALP